MYKLPRGRSLIENIKIEFINFDNVLHAGKRDRANRIDGYISILYPEYVDFLFLKQGEPSNAGRFFENKREQVTIKDVVDKVKNAELGIMSIYEVPLKMLEMVISTFHIEPIINDGTIKTHDPQGVIDKIKNKKFSGFMEIKKGVELFYISFKDGKIIDGFFAEKLNVAITYQMLEKIMTSTGKNGVPVRFSLYEGFYENTEQIPLSEQELLLELFNKMMMGFIESAGAPIASNMFKSAYAVTIRKYPIMKSYNIKDELYLDGEVIASREDVCDGFGFLTQRVADTIINTIGSEKVKNIVRTVYKEYRFALDRMGFWNQANGLKEMVNDE